jgi:hypothetical protein
MMRSHYNRLVFVAAGGFAVAAEVVVACCNGPGELGVCQHPIPLECREHTFRGFIHAEIA